MRGKPNYNAIIADYRALRSQGNDTWLLDCAKTRDVVHVIEMAALARDLDNDKHPHQHRIPNVVLRQFADRLLKNAEAILVCKTFTQLHDLITSLRSRGIGRLTVYDTAHRIGTRLRIRPDKVYMHQGTRVGTELYLGRKVLEKAVDKSQFSHFRHLSCEEIEDIMCIYKDDFLDSKSAGKTRSKNC